MLRALAVVRTDNSDVACGPFEVQEPAEVSECAQEDDKFTFHDQGRRDDDLDVLQLLPGDGIPPVAALQLQQQHVHAQPTLIPQHPYTSNKINNLHVNTRLLPELDRRDEGLKLLTDPGQLPCRDAVALHDVLHERVPLGE